VIAALYVEAGGIYCDLDGVDPWDESRDARRYVGPYPVVAHPPCARWSYALAALAEARYGIPREQDGGCFEHALATVRTFGGVLEHPAHSTAWRRFGMVQPAAGGGWSRPDAWGGRSCAVEQGHYGHRARKPTWLYAAGGAFPELRWGESKATAWVSWGDSEKYPDVQRLGRRERKATPREFRDLMLMLAGTCAAPPEPGLKGESAQRAARRLAEQQTLFEGVPRRFGRPRRRGPVPEHLQRPRTKPECRAQLALIITDD